MIVLIIRKDLGHDYRGWAICTDGGTRVVHDKIFAGWSVISRSPHGRIDVMFGPVVTTEAYLAFSGVKTHSNNTVDMTAMIEALAFLGPQGPVTSDEQSCIFYDSMHAAGICLGTIQARTHVQLALACRQSMIRAQRRLRFTIQHVYAHGGNLVTNARIILLPLALTGLSLATTSPRVGFGTPLTLTGVSMGTTISVKHLNHFSTSRQTLLPFIRKEFSIGTFPRVPCVMCVPHACYCHGSHLLSAFCFCFLWFIAFPTSGGSNFFIRVYCFEH